MPSWRLLDLPRISDGRGYLSVVEANRHIPFAIERVYYLYEVPGNLARAGHAHKQLQQLMIPVAGSFNIMLDNGRLRETFTMDKPWQGIVLDSMVWRDIDAFSPDCVCLVLASRPYEESDYYRNYDDFKTALEERA